MTPVEEQFSLLKAEYTQASLTRLASGAHLVQLPGVQVPSGWNHSHVTVLFVAPPGYPAAQPDCFWIEPKPFRLSNGGTPQGSNDSNEIPEVGPRGTWFSWHLQHWNPNTSTLKTYLNVIMRRLNTVQ
jgi:hypothetical protein